MIVRTWHGWTTPANAEAYRTLLLGTILPDIEARDIAGLLNIDVLRRDVGDEVEFTTLMLFDSEAAIRRFVGDDVTVAHVPDSARAVLARFDARAVHREVIDRRARPDHARGRG